MSEPKVIYLGPACEASTGDGRTWAEDNPWPDCECGHRPVQYVLGETFERMKAERDALQLRLNAADQRIDELTAQQAESRIITLSGCDFSEHDLIRTAVRMVTGTSLRGTQRWVAMKDAFCCGSGVAHALCRRFGYDPDETVKP